ncbi:unnamed protein product [Fusarium equiseti]|uniref:Zinc ribbon domain-containing protein n=1 Tax=Fusarium equiseti TaxID=61235 RepID=A0A8J2IU23_FUSEQ|nr:unnamed protein product [Fusarium equiseti]
MFGRRRRPILGAAVVVGASRAAAKHEVRKQELAAAERDREIQREIELRRYEDERQEQRTQRAVDEAMKKAALQEQAAQQSNAVMKTPQQPQYNEAYPVVQVQTQDMGLYNSVNDAPTVFEPAPAYRLAPEFVDERPRKSPIPSPAPAPRVRYCTQCGVLCQDTDRFCRQCGTKQLSAGDMVG